MRWIVWTIGIGGLALWTALSLGAYALVSAGGDWLILQSDAYGLDPDSVVWVAWVKSLVQDFGLVMLVLLWLAVSVGIVVLTAAFGRIARRFTRSGRNRRLLQPFARA